MFARVAAYLLSVGAEMRDEDSLTLLGGSIALTEFSQSVRCPIVRTTYTVQRFERTVRLVCVPVDVGPHRRVLLTEPQLRSACHVRAQITTVQNTIKGEHMIMIFKGAQLDTCQSGLILPGTYKRMLAEMIIRADPGPFVLVLRQHCTMACNCHTVRRVINDFLLNHDFSPRVLDSRPAWPATIVEKPLENNEKPSHPKGLKVVSPDWAIPRTIS